MSGPSVTIITRGGIPVTNVVSGAPELTVVDSGGMAVTIVDTGGIPFVLENYSPGGGTGTALSAPTLTRTSDATTYPPTVDFDRPVDWIDGIEAVMQRSQDATFATGVSEAVQTIESATLTYDFGLSNIASGSWFMRMAAWSGSRPADGSLNWSNIVNVGDTVAPTITGGGATSSAENAPMAVTVTSSELAYFTLGGTDAALLELNSAALNTSVIVRLAGNANLNYEAKASYSYTVTATDPAGNASTPLACTHTVTNVVENPSGLVNFTTTTGAPVSTAETSNTQTISGLPTGYNALFTVTNGTLVKNGTNAGASGTVTNGDVIALTGTSSSSNNATVNVTLAVGGDSPQVSVTYSIATVSSIPQIGALSRRHENTLSTLKQSSTGSTPVASAGDVVGYWADLSGNNRTLTSEADNTTRPTFQITGGINEVKFDGVDDLLRWSGASTLYTASGYTAMLCMRSNSPGTAKYLLASAADTVSAEFIGIVGSNGTTAANGNTQLRNDSNAQFLASTVNQFTNAHDGSNHVIIVVDDGSGVTWYVDGVAGTRQAYTRSGNSISNLDNVSLGGVLRLSLASPFPGYVQGCLIWPGVVLNSTEIAQATTYGGTLQGRSL